MAEGYSHRFHAGNVGDVWKHSVLTGLVTATRAAAADRRLVVIETHAGEGSYELGPTGEWTEGIGRLWEKPPAIESPLLRRYLDLVPSPGGGGPRRYPGSPAITLSLLGPNDRLVLCEIDAQAHAVLSQGAGRDRRAQLHLGDGLALLPKLLDEAGDAELLVIVDPPYGLKSDWIDIPEALVKTWRQRRQAKLCLWYPVKSYTRPNAMLQALGKTGMPATTIELITTPLELQHNRLNGSGMLFVNAPAAFVTEAAAAATILGRVCATRNGRWTTRCISWGE